MFGEIEVFSSAESVVIQYSLCAGGMVYNLATNVCNLYL